MKQGPRPKAKPKPDAHQDEAIAAVVDGLKKSDRGQMIMVCGTGKTFTTLWIKEAMDAQTTLVLLPSLNLLSQTMREWSCGSKGISDILNDYLQKQSELQPIKPRSLF